MSNAIVDLRITIELPAAVVEDIAGRPDDGSQAWHEHAWHAVRAFMEDNPMHYLEYGTSEDVEVIM